MERFTHTKELNPLTDTVGLELFLTNWVEEQKELFPGITNIELTYEDNGVKTARLVVEGEGAEAVGNELVAVLPFKILFPF